jgi:hypothetical protein
MSEERRLGSRYVLGELVGRGGMGEVYRARNEVDGSSVAVKLLRSELATDPKLVGRFIQERDILIALDHPNLVRVRDLVVEGNDLAIVMDLVEGGDLRHALQTRGGTLGAGVACHIAAQVLDALGAVHAAGVIHRDVKPENILIPLGPQLTAKLSDFGVARVTSDRVLSSHNSLVGTSYYIAPELADGAPVSSAADLYSVGCMLYELISGTVPFAGSTLLVLRRHAEEDPLPIPGLPDDLWQFVAALMDKQPALRPTAIEAAEQARHLARRYASLAPLSPMAPPDPRIQSTGGRLLRASWTGGPSTDGPGTGADETAHSRRNPAHAAAAGTATALRPRFAKDRSEGAASGAEHTRVSWYRTPALVAPVAVVGLLALAAGILVVARRGGDGDAATPAPRVASEATYASAPVVYDNGVVATRIWKLGGDEGSTLRGSVEITNASATPVSMDIEEVIPKSAAESVDNIVFTPAPDRIIERDPIVSYSVKDLAANATKVFTYTTVVPSSSEDRASRISIMGAQRDAIVKARAISSHDDSTSSLKEVVISPASLEVEPGAQFQVALGGLMTDGKEPIEAILKGVVFTSSDINVASVVAGPSPKILTVTGVGVGSATVTAQAGDIKTTLAVTVKKAGGVEIAAPGATKAPSVKTTPSPATAPPATAPPATAPPATAPPGTAPPPTAPPAAPGQMAAPNLATADHAVTLTFVAPTSGTAAISRFDALGSDGPTRVLTAPGQSIGSLTNGTSYTFQVRACSSVGCGPWSASSAAAIPAGLPLAPAGLAQTDASLTAIRVSWQAANGNGRGVTAYELLVDGATVVNVGNTTTWVHGALGSSQTHTYAIRSITTLGSSGWSGAVSGRSSDPPAATVSISKGAQRSVTGCTVAACANVVVTFSNFAAGSHSVACYSDVDAGAYYTYSTSTATTQVCVFGYSGRRAWVTVDGVQSNSIIW